jgi:NAD(P)H dehydrogenase (quinone)
MLAHSKAVIDAAKQVGSVQHIMHLGAYASDDTTIVHLGWHQMIEVYLQHSGLGFTHLRPNWYMQNLLAYGGQDNQSSGVITQYIGQVDVSWVDCDDIAKVAAAILLEPDRHDGKTYPLAAEAHSMDSVAQIFTEVTGKRFRYEPQEPEEFLESVLSAGADAAYMKCVANVFARTREGSLPEAAHVFTTIEEITGEKPTTLREFALKHAAELR